MRGMLEAQVNANQKSESDLETRYLTYAEITSLVKHFITCEGHLESS